MKLSLKYGGNDVQIQLLDYQVDHVSQLKNVLENSWFAIDTSLLGTGKTYTSAYIAHDYTHVIVIAPKSVASKWEFIKKEYKIDQLKWIGTFHKLRSHSFPYLHFNEQEKTFTPTQHFQDIISNNKVLVIMDELQNIKNRSLQSLATKAMLRVVCQHGHQSKFLGLSGSPIDKKEQAENLYDILGFLEEPIHYCRGNHYPLVQQTIHSILLGREKAGIFDKIFKIFKDDFKIRFIRRMKIPNNPVNLNIVNAYYPLSTTNNFKNHSILVDAFAQFNDLNLGRPGKKRGNNIKKLAMLTVILHHIETAKVDTMCEIVQEQLDIEPSCKVVLLYNFTDSIEKSKDVLSKYNPLIFTGKVNSEQRGIMLTQFSEASLKHRLIIGNLTVMSTGIDLDDKHGNYKRYCFCNPNYNSITLYQLNHRFKRANSKSDAMVQYIFIRYFKEKQMLSSLERKRNVMMDVGDDQVDAGVEFNFKSVYYKDNILHKFARIFI
jgi:hypothetical protein